MDKVQKKIDSLAKKYKGKKVLLYGAGKYATEVMYKHNFAELDIVGIVDKKYSKTNPDTDTYRVDDCSYFNGIKTYGSEDIKNLKCDSVVCLLINKTFQAVKESLLSKKQIDEKKTDIVGFDEDINYELSTDFANKKILTCGIGSSVFKEYLLEHNMKDMIENLKKNLDKKSIETVDFTLKKILYLPYHCECSNYAIDKDYLKKMFERKGKDKIVQQYAKEYPEYFKKYPMSMREYERSVFFYHHGIRNASDKLKKYLKGKDFIDAGAYIGDSVLILNEYLPRKVYSFDISKKNEKLYNKTMELNHISKDKAEMFNIGISDRTFETRIGDTGGIGVSMYNKGKDVLKCTSIDDFRKGHNLNVGFVKADVEGFVIPVINGMKETIKKDRPVLSLAIYHTPEEFFEAKPLLDEITKNLDYTVEIQYQDFVDYTIYETILFAYPKELK